MRNKKKKTHQRDNPKEVDKLVKDLENSKTTKMIYEFHPQHTATIKTLGVKKNGNIKPSTRVFAGKMLMFAKLSLKSFIYDLNETFMFPN